MNALPEPQEIVVGVKRSMWKMAAASRGIRAPKANHS